MTLVIPRVADPSGILSVTVEATVLHPSVPAFLLGSARVNNCKAIGGLVGEPGKRLQSNRWVGRVKKT